MTSFLWTALVTALYGAMTVLAPPVAVTAVPVYVAAVVVPPCARWVTGHVRARRCNTSRPFVRRVVA